MKQWRNQGHEHRVKKKKNYWKIRASVSLWDTTTMYLSYMKLESQKLKKRAGEGEVPAKVLEEIMAKIIPCLILKNSQTQNARIKKWIILKKIISTPNQITESQQ